MGLHVKNSHGKDFLYYLMGKDQIFIGPKSEYDKGDLPNVSKAIDHYDTKIEKILDKYVSEILELSNYMPEPERKEYLSKRSAELLARLRRLEPAPEIATEETIPRHLTNEYKFEKSDPNDIKKALVSLSIEKALLDLGEVKFDKFVEHLYKNYKISLSDCYEHPNYLQQTLHEIFGNSYADIIKSIKRNLEEFGLNDQYIEKLNMSLGRSKRTS